MTKYIVAGFRLKSARRMKIFRLQLVILSTPILFSRPSALHGRVRLKVGEGGVSPDQDKNIYGSSAMAKSDYSRSRRAVPSEKFLGSRRVTRRIRCRGARGIIFKRGYRCPVRRGS